MSWRYITNKNLKQTEGSTVKEINGNKKYTVAKVGRNMISIVNDFGFAQFISRQAFKDFYVVQEVE